MKRLHYSIQIKAPKAKVWQTMLQDETYRQWTEAFAKGSHFVGNWSKGSKILFLASSEEGGMVSRIIEHRPNEFLSIEHIGIVSDGVEDTTSPEARKWAGGALENYTLRETNGTIEVQVDMDTDDEHADMFAETWPKALQKLKELAEK